MTALVNPYFNQSKLGEQGVMDGFMRESIQILGHEYFYLPRDVQISDPVLGEDVLSKFSLAIGLEMYLADAQGFQGDKEMFSKFGLNIQNQYKLVVHKARWEEEVKSQFDDSIYGISGTIALESNNNYSTYVSHLLMETGDRIGVEVISGEAAFDISNYIRPREGDLIYDPLTKYLFEIKFVDHDVEFFSLGKNYQYYLTCEAFQYQQNEIATGIADIDVFATNSLDKLLNQLLMEDGSAAIFETEGFIILEDELAHTRPYGTEFSPMQERIKFTVDNIFQS